MGNIRSYTSQVRAPGPVGGRRLDNSDLAPMGRAVQNLGNSAINAAETINKRLAQDEVSDLTAKMSAVHADFTNRLRDKVNSADPGDREFTGKFLDEFDKHLEQYQDNIQTADGRQFLTVRMAQMRGHFLEAASSARADLAGRKAAQDFTDSLNNFSSSLLNDPSSFEMASQMMDQDLETRVRSGMLPREAAMKLQPHAKQELAQAAIRGWADLNPDEAKAQLKSGKWDSHLSGDLKNQLMGEIDQGIRAKEIEDERRKRALEEEQKAAINQTQNDFLGKMTTGELTTKDILKSNLPAFGSGSKEQFLKMMKNNALDQTNATNPALYNDLFQRIHADDNDPRKLIDENELNDYLGKGLSLKSIKELRGELQGKGTEQGKAEAQLKKGLDDIAKSRLTKTDPLTGLMDPVGAENLQRWRSEFNEQWIQKRKEGKKPQQLLDPNSPDYLGKSIDNYRRTSEQIIKDLTKNTKKNPAAAPKMENETPEQYLKRTSKGS